MALRAVEGLIQLLSQPGSSLYSLCGNRVWLMGSSAQTYANDKPALMLFQRSGDRAPGAAVIETMTMQINCYGGQYRNGQRSFDAVESVYRALQDKLCYRHNVALPGVAQGVLMKAILQNTRQDFDQTKEWPRRITFWDMKFRER